MEGLPHLDPNHENFLQTLLSPPSLAIPSPTIHYLNHCNSLLSVSLLPKLSVSNSLFPCNHNYLSKINIESA